MGQPGEQEVRAASLPLTCQVQVQQVSTAGHQLHHPSVGHILAPGQLQVLQGRAVLAKQRQAAVGQPAGGVTGGQEPE